MKTTWLKLRRALELCDDPPVTQQCTKSSGASEKETERLKEERCHPYQRSRPATNQNNLPNASVSVHAEKNEGTE